MTVQDDERERELVRTFNLAWDPDHQRAGVDALLSLQIEDKHCQFEVEVKSTTGSTVSTARDVGIEHIRKWRRKLFVIGFYTKEHRRPELQRCLCLTPLDMEPWIAFVESKIAIDYALASMAARKLELTDLFQVCGEHSTNSLADAKRLHKSQWTAKQYQDALDTNVEGEHRISQARMLDILKLRARYIAERGATLNNPHIPKAHLDSFIGAPREISAPDWAESIRRIAREFAKASPSHPAILFDVN